MRLPGTTIAHRHPSFLKSHGCFVFVQQEQRAGVEGLAGMALAAERIRFEASQNPSLMIGVDRQACSQRSDLMLPMLPLLDSFEASMLSALKHVHYSSMLPFRWFGPGRGGGAGRPQKSIVFGIRLKLSIAALVRVC